jgi:hypothetical protein
MPTRTQPARRATPTRFGRPAGSPAPRPAARRPATASRRPAIVPRRKPQKTGMAKMMESVGAALPGAAKSSRGGGGGKGKGIGAGVAVLAGAAGLAMKNRGRIQGMLRRKDQDRMAHADAPAHPVVEVQPGGGPVDGAPPESDARPAT